MATAAAFMRLRPPIVSCSSSSTSVACMHRGVQKFHVLCSSPRSFASSCLRSDGRDDSSGSSGRHHSTPPRPPAAGATTRTAATTAASAGQPHGAAAAAAAADAAAVAQELPTAAFGQVISAEANFVRVNISHPDTTIIISSSSSSSQPAPPAPPVTQLLCTVRALLKKIGQRVLVGDNVRVHPIDWTDGRGVVEAVQPRSSELADPAVANVDHVLLLFGLTHPPFEPAQVSRFLVSLGASGLPVTLALNKADLLPAAEIQDRIDQVAAWGYAAVAVSCETGLGIDQLAHRLAGKVSVVAGPSGAGKSSLINALRLGRHKPDAPSAASAAAAGGGVQWQYDQVPQQQPTQQQWPLPPPPPPQKQQQPAQHADVLPAAASSSSNSSSSSLHASSNGSNSSSSSNTHSTGGSGFLAVGDVSRIGRGRHTTRTVTLIELPFGGYMADTPGFNQPTLDRISSAELAGLFPEFQAAQQEAGGCRFADCMHLAEPGCVVTDAELERHDHYVKFLAEIKAREDYDVRVMQLTKARREGAFKAKTGRGGATRYEARLDSKKHRSTSRRRLKQQSSAADWGEDVGGEEEEEEQEAR